MIEVPLTSKTVLWRLFTLILARKGSFWSGEWLFPAMLPADFDLEPFNLADQFVLSCLVSDMLPRNAGGVPPVFGD